MSVLLLLMIAVPVAVPAQELPPAATAADAPAHIAYVDGVAILERDGETDDSPTSMPLLAGDRVRTRGGRVEILFADGATLHLDHNTVIDLQSDELVRLVQGRIRLSIPGPQRAVGYRIDGPHGWALIDEPGEYRVALLNAPNGSELELAVIRGRAELANDGGRTPLRAGERAFVRASAAPSYAFIANSAALDAFDRWSELRRDERLGASAQYLPDEARPYAGALDRHGYWRDEPIYGRVWYPRVEAGWRPYYRGRWTHLRPYGWTWVAHDPWGWPTHHYGRWGFAASGWFWIPGRSWGAAWVSWASAPGYVSWCPLGWNNRPVFQINVNIGRGYDPWRAWTVLPYRSFGRGYVHRNIVRVDHLDTRTRGAFRVAERAPIPQGYAVPRGTTPIRSAGAATARGDAGVASRRDDAGVAVRRGDNVERGGGDAGVGARPGAASPVYSNLPPDRGRMRSDGARIRVPNAAEDQRGHASGSVAVPRERTTPIRPATRAQRPADSSDRGAVVLRGQSGARQRTDPVEATSPANKHEDRRAASPRAVGPEAARTAPSVRSEPPQERSRPAVRRAGAPRQIESTAPVDGPSRRAVPRVEGARPSTAEPLRAPAPERRGPYGPSSGSYERRSPADAQPSAPPPAAPRVPAPPSAAPRSSAAPAGSAAPDRSSPRAAPRSGGDRPAAASPGARPRPSGGGGSGGSLTRPGGGRSGGQ